MQTGRGWCRLCGRYMRKGRETAVSGKRLTRIGPWPDLATARLFLRGMVVVPVAPAAGLPLSLRALNVSELAASLIQAELFVSPQLLLAGRDVRTSWRRYCCLCSWWIAPGIWPVLSGAPSGRRRSGWLRSTAVPSHVGAMCGISCAGERCRETAVAFCLRPFENDRRPPAADCHK